MVTRKSAKKTTLAVEMPTLTEIDFDRLRLLSHPQQYRMAPFHLPLSMKLAASQPTPSTAVTADVVTMRSRVRIRDTRSGDSDEYTLVYPDEADIDQNKVSVLAPLGLALLGSVAGQTISFEAPGGERRVRIEEIVYQPERAGDFHL